MPDVMLIYKTSDSTPMVIERKHLSLLESACGGTVTLCGTEEEALQSGNNPEILAIWGGSGSPPTAFCLRDPKLRWVNILAAGYDPVMSSVIWELPVLISNSGGIHGKPMALTTAGYIIALLRQFPRIFRQQREHRWLKQSGSLPTEAEGLTACVFGAGSIGGEVARMAQGLGMKTVGVRRRPAACDGFDLMVSTDDFKRVVPDCDFLIVTAPLTDETRGVIDGSILRLMKPDAFLINIARGAIVNEDDLLDALRSGTIAGAALDAFQNEPLPEDSPFWEMDNVILTPHVSALSDRYMDRAVELFADNISRYLKNEPMINVVKQAAAPLKR